MEYWILICFIGAPIYVIWAFGNEKRKAIKIAKSLPADQRLAFVSAWNSGKMLHRCIQVEDVLK